ncbi:MAG: hypothetical protein K940chlam8_00631 [Chlamydiae bacterium]|nr:hypothetical protein [Chlamydiota bacterium]
MSTNPLQECHQIMNRLRELRNQDIEELKQQAFQIAQEFFAHLNQNPFLQAMEVCDKGFHDFEHQIEEQFKTSSERDIARMYLQSEASQSFHSRQLQDEICQRLILGH